MRSSYRVLFLLILASNFVNAASVVLSQNFDNVNALGSAGWAIRNNSNPVGSTSWFQGNPATFSSQSGAANSYIAANFNAANFAGNVSDWLVTPTVSLDSTETLTFYTRSNGAAPDRLEVRLSTNGASTNVGTTDTSVGDFNILLLSVNPTLSAGGYPTDWMLQTVSLAPFSGLSSGRFAFRYYVPNTSVNADYIGLDTLSLTTDIPEPGSGALLVSSVLAALLCKQGFRKRRRQQVQSAEEII